MDTIPPMTDDLGRHWEQPADICDAPFDDEIVLLTPRQFAGLHEYNATIPTGVYDGKCWKRVERDRTLLMWYGPSTNPAHCSINWREIVVVS